MSVKFVSVKCPECGATLPIKECRKIMFCAYCGSKIMMVNENEYIYRHIDEAEMKQAETERIIQMKKMEMMEKKREENEKIKRMKIRITIILGILAVGCIGLGYLGANAGFIMPGMICCIIMMYMWINNGSEDSDLGDKIKVPFSVSNYEDKNYADIEAAFSSAGFKNIKTIPLNDLTVGVLKKPGMVESITINGSEIISGWKKYSPEAKVVIAYHSYRQ